MYTYRGVTVKLILSLSLDVNFNMNINVDIDTDMNTHTNCKKILGSRICDHHRGTQKSKPCPQKNEGNLDIP